MNLSFKNIAPFLNTGENRASRWLSYFGLGIGVLLLLCSVQMYININQLLKERNPKKTGFDFISVTKTITDQNMAKDNRFTEQDLAEIKSQPFITDAALLRSNQFKVVASAGQVIPFSTDIFIEAIPDNFIDTVPPNFTWQEGQAEVPVIFSSDLLEMYNVFSSSWDLPQLSEKSAMGIALFLNCDGRNGERQFRSHIVAFSDRINSILVPANFLDAMNKQLEAKENVPASRVYLKTKDANNPELLDFLQQKNYHVNKDKTKFGRIKQILQAIVTGLAGFGVLVILLATVLFSFYLQLMIARSKENLQLLLTLGYSPQWLSKTVAKKWIPVYIAVVIAAVIATAILHWGFQHFAMNDREELSPFIHWSVAAIAVLLLFISVAVNFRLVKKLLYKL
ncbi:FtsX-like permease family protein [Ferruginibacter sp.]